MSPRSLILLLLGAVAAFFLHREQQRGFFAPLDAPHVRWLLDNRKDTVVKQAPNLIFVRLDDLDKPDGERQFETWPPSAADWAGLLEEMARHRPGAIAVHPVLGWGATADPALTKQARSFRRALFGLRGEAGGSDVPMPPAAAGELAEIVRVTGDRGAVPAFTSLPAIEEVAALGAAGITHLDLSDAPGAKLTVKDGECRAPLLFRQGSAIFPSFLLRAVCLDLEIAPADVEVRLGDAILLGDRLRIPVDAGGGFTFYLDPANEQALPALNLDTFKLSAEQLERFLPRDDPAREVLPKLPGALLWIAQDDTASRRLVLPGGKPASAAELGARVLLAIETGRNIAPLSPPGQAAASGGAVLLCLWQSRCRRRNVWKFGLGAMLLLGMASLLTFQSFGVWLPLGPSLGILALGTVANTILRHEPAPQAPPAAG